MEQDQYSILTLMINHHALLETLFYVFKDDLGTDPEKAKEALSTFRWEYEKHMFAEENIIFEFLKWNHPKVFQITVHLTNEHEAIRHLIDKIESEMPTEATKEVTSLQALLSGHRKDEEDHLYPVVDKELSDMQKSRIILRINEIAPRNYTKE